MAKSNRRAVSGERQAERLGAGPGDPDRPAAPVCGTASAKCSRRLLDSPTCTQIKQAHWTVQGRTSSRCTVVRPHRGEVDGYADEIAGADPDARGHAGAPALVGARLRAVPLAAVRSRDHNAGGRDALAAYGKLVRQAIDQCDRGATRTRRICSLR